MILPFMKSSKTNFRFGCTAAITTTTTCTHNCLTMRIAYKMGQLCIERKYTAYKNDEEKAL